MDRDSLISAIHGTPLKLVLSATGGGATAIGDLLRVPGASNTVLAAIAPYAATATKEWLGFKPERYCDERTSRLLAMRAFQRALELVGEGEPLDNLIGVGCAASLASTRPKRGEHRAHLAMQSMRRTTVWSFTLSKGVRLRQEEERLVADLLLNLIASAAGLYDALDLELDVGDILREEKTDAPRAWIDLTFGKLDAVFCVKGQVVDGVDPARTPVLLPGSFFPFHEGHRQMLQAAERILGEPIALEMSVHNVDKPPLDYHEIAHRLDAVGFEFPVWMTNAPTFEEKSRTFPNATFVVGADTIVRIADPKYYGGTETQRDEAIDHLRNRGNHFLVLGRLAGGEPGAPFRALSDLDIPDSLRALCREVTEEEFRIDISSSELRRRIYPNA